MDIRSAILAVVNECPNEYAKAYAREALSMAVGGMKLETQLLYIQSNLQYWRGDRARQIKRALVNS